MCMYQVMLTYLHKITNNVNLASVPVLSGSFLMIAIVKKLAMLNFEQNIRA